MSAPRAAVVTGLGTLGAAGCGREELARRLALGSPRTEPVEPIAGLHRGDSARRAASVSRPDFLPWLTPMAARRMSRPSKFAVVAARQALADADLEPGDFDADTVPVMLATAFGPTDYTERILAQIFDEGPAATSPALFTESVANAPAAQVALALAARGPNVTVTQREAGPLIALAAAAAEIESGRTEVAVAGAVDEINPLLHALLDRLGALARPSGGHEEAARPFDRRRNGFLLAEGASVVILESERHAAARGARVLARFSGAVSAFDPAAPVIGWAATPDTLATRLAAGLERTGESVARVDRIVSTASGSRHGDRLEAGILTALWGDRPLPPILAPKAVTGEYGGGLLAAAVLAAAGETFAATAGFEQPDPQLGVTPHDGRELPAPRQLLVSALAAGGAAAWVVLEAGDA